MAREWLKALRLEKYPSQSALARAAGISPARYSRLELGYSELREDEIRSLSSVLDVTEDFVLTGKRKRATTRKKSAAAAPEPEQPSAPLPTPAAPVVAPPEPPKGLAAAAAASATPPASAPTAASPVIATAPAPTPASPAPGDDLSDPANFTLVPSPDVLNQGSLSAAEFRNRLQQQAAFSTKVLHTSKVKPRIWVAWRDFGKEVERVLRGDSPAPSPASTPSPAKDTAPAPAARPRFVAPSAPPAPKPVMQRAPSDAAQPAPRAKFNKNLFGHFVDAAREFLRPEQLSEIEKLAAVAKEKEPETGFMKHFKRIAEIHLPRPEYERISAEAEQRFNPRPTTTVQA